MGVVYEFSGLRLDPQRRQLSTRRGRLVPLSPRAFDALHVLVQRPGELIDKALLMRTIWPDVAVADNSLDQIISRLRRALDECGAESWITTERGRGYRFTADVTVVTGAEAAPRTSGPRSEAPTVDPRANQFYLQALTLSVRPGPDNLMAAFELLQQALALEPKFATALAYRALLRTVFVAFDLPMEDALTLAEQEARAALEIDPALAYGHHGLANVSAARGAWVDAEAHYETASRLESAPHARVSRIYQLYQPVGHLRRSLAEAESIDRLAPSQPLGTVAAALAAMLLGRNDDAQRHADRARAFGWPRTNPALQDIYFQLAIRGRRFADAADAMNTALSAAMQAAGASDAIERLCRAMHDRGERDAAVAALCAVVERVPANDLGLVDRRRLILWLTMLDALDAAFELADASFEHFARRGMFGSQWGMLWMPEMQAFRRDLRFQQVAARLRLPDYWRRYGPPDGEVA